MFMVDLRQLFVGGERLAMVVAQGEIGVDPEVVGGPCSGLERKGGRHPHPVPSMGGTVVFLGWRAKRWKLVRETGFPVAEGEGSVNFWLQAGHERRSVGWTRFRSATRIAS